MKEAIHLNHPQRENNENAIVTHKTLQLSCTTVSVIVLQIAQSHNGTCERSSKRTHNDSTNVTRNDRSTHGAGYALLECRAEERRTVWCGCKSAG